MTFFNPHPRICLSILERKKGERKGGIERDKHQCGRETQIASRELPDPRIKLTTFSF